MLRAHHCVRRMPWCELRFTISRNPAKALPLSGLSDLGFSFVQGLERFEKSTKISPPAVCLRSPSTSFVIWAPSEHT